MKTSKQHQSSMVEQFNSNRESIQQQQYKQKLHHRIKRDNLRCQTKSTTSSISSSSLLALSSWSFVRRLYFLVVLCPFLVSKTTKTLFYAEAVIPYSQMPYYLQLLNFSQSSSYCPNYPLTSYQKISSSQGSFTETLDNSDVFGRTVSAI